MSIKFYYAPMSSASRVHASLEELGVPYERVTFDLKAGDQKKPEFLAINPNGQVPAIEIDGTPMFESVAIQIALGERYGVEKGVWPALGSSEHLQALTWLLWGQVTLGTSMFRYMANVSDYIPKEQHNEKAAEAALKDLHSHLGILNTRLSDREFLTGDRFTLADLDLGSVLGWGLHMTKIDVAAYPKIAAWLGRVSERPGAKKASQG